MVYERNAKGRCIRKDCRKLLLDRGDYIITKKGNRVCVCCFNKGK